VRFEYFIPSPPDFGLGGKRVFQSETVQSCGAGPTDLTLAEVGSEGVE
jgi:hypothetical protein